MQNLDEVGIDRAVAFPLGAPYTDYSESNRIVAEEVAKFPDRIIGFCRVNPNSGHRPPRPRSSTAWARWGCAA